MTENPSAKRKAEASVVLIANNFPPVRGGSGAVYANLARCAGGRILIIAPRIGYTDALPLVGWREYDRVAPFPVRRLPLLRTTIERRPGGLSSKIAFLADDVTIRARVAASLFSVLVRERPQAVCIGELLASGWLFNLLRFVPGLRTVAYVHGEEITTEDPYDRGAVRRTRALLAADRVVVVSRFTQRAVVEMLGPREAGRVFLVENGVDTARFTPAARSEELVARYSLQGRFVFVTVCRLLEKKGVDHVLRAFARLLAGRADITYLIVGSGPFEPALRALVEELRIGHAVVFAGNVPEHELVEHYRLGDVFALPNRALANGDTEGFGLVFLEANGCGLPVIAGRDGGSADAVRDGENGLVVDGNSVDEIHRAMLRLLTDEELRARIGRLGLDAARAADWRSRTESFLRVCLQL